MRERQLTSPLQETKREERRQVPNSSSSAAGMQVFVAVPSVLVLRLRAVWSALVRPQLELVSTARTSRQLQEARPAAQQRKAHHLPHSHLEGYNSASSWAPPGPADLSGPGAGRGKRGSFCLHGGPMFAAPEKTFEVGVKIPSQSCTSPRTQIAPGRTTCREPLQVLSYREAADFGGGGRKKTRKLKKRAGRKGGGRGLTAGGRTAKEGMGCAERGAGFSRSR